MPAYYQSRFQREVKNNQDHTYTAASSSGSHPSVTLSSVNATGHIDSPKKARYAPLNAHLVGEDWANLKEPSVEQPSTKQPSIRQRTNTTGTVVHRYSLLSVISAKIHGDRPKLPKYRKELSYPSSTFSNASDIITSTPPRYRRPVAEDATETDTVIKMPQPQGVTTLLDNLATAQETSSEADDSDLFLNLATELNHTSPLSDKNFTDGTERSLPRSSPKPSVPEYSLPDSDRVPKLNHTSPLSDKNFTNGTERSLPRSSPKLSVPEYSLPDSDRFDKLNHIDDFVSGSLLLTGWCDDNKNPVLIRHGQAQDQKDPKAQNQHADFESVTLPEVEQKIFVSLDKVREDVRALQEHDEFASKQAERLSEEVRKLEPEVAQNEHLRHEIEALKARLERADFENKKKDIEIQSLKNKYSDAVFVNNNQESMIDYQRRRMATLATSLKEASGKDVVDAQLVEMKEKLATSDSKLVATQSQLVEVKQKLATSNTKLAATQSQLVEVKEKLATSNTKLAATQSQLIEVKEKLATSNTKLAVSQTKRFEANTKLATTKRELEEQSKIKEERPDTKKKLFEAKKELAETHLELYKTRNKLNTALKEKAILQQENIDRTHTPDLTPPQMAIPPFAAKGKSKDASAESSKTGGKDRFREINFEHVLSGLDELEEEATFVLEQYAGSDTTRPCEHPAVALARVMNSLRREEKNLQYAILKKQAVYNKCDPAVHKRVWKKLHDEIKELYARRDVKRDQIYDLQDIVVSQKEGTAIPMNTDDVNDTVMTILRRDPDWDGIEHLSP